MKFWKPGDPLTNADLALLEPLKQKAAALGRTPKVAEVESAANIKARFRIWKYAVLAAGLPSMNDPAQTQKREAESRLPDAQ